MLPDHSKQDAAKLLSQVGPGKVITWQQEFSLSPWPFFRKESLTAGIQSPVYSPFPDKQALKSPPGTQPWRGQVIKSAGGAEEVSVSSPGKASPSLKVCGPEKDLQDRLGIHNHRSSSENEPLSI